MLDHPNIIKIFDVFEENLIICEVFEFCTGGELFDRIIKQGHFTEKKAAEVMSQILSAVAHCHEKNIVHRDLKPENILLENETDNSPLKIIRFDTSKTFDSRSKMVQRLGTVIFSLKFQSLITSHLKFWKNVTMKNAMFGVVELSFIFSLPEDLLLMGEMMMKF